MPVLPWIVDGHVRWGCRNSHEDWREEPGDNSKNNSLTWSKKRQLTWFPCCEMKLVQQVYMTLLTFQLRIACSFVWRNYRRRQTNWSQQWKQWGYGKLTFIQTSELSWMTWHFCLHGIEHSCTHGRKMLLPRRIKDFSLTSSTSRTVPCNVCENFHGFWGSRCHENNVCTKRLTHLFIHEDDGIAHVHCWSNHFFSVSHFSFFPVLW